MNGLQDAPRELNQQPQGDARGPAPTQPPYPPPPWQRKDYYREDPRYKSPALATLLSLMPGLGQIYVGYYQQGFINILVIGFLLVLLTRGEGPLTPLFGIFLAFYWLYNLVDAARRATFYNQAIAGLGPAELPEGIKSPDRRGSLFAGVLMVVVGAIAFLYTEFGISLRWVERWWPMALVLMGAYLIYQSWVAKKKKDT